MLEGLIGYWSGHEGVRFTTFEDAAADFRHRYPFTGTDRPSLIGP
ncbi:hypothetical protein [Saccharopolyspora sp. NPDC002376]